jgi:RimJ/RimL family protein N-acetyltransferase
MTPHTLLRSTRLRLVALTENDLQIIAEWFQDTEFMRLLDAVPAHPKSITTLQTWLEEANKATDGYLFGVRLLESDALIGYIELDGILWNHGTAWLGVALGARKYWGQGYGTEATRLVLDFAFQELNLHRVQATVFRYNRRSVAMCERLGFQREGIYREFIHRDGQRYDMILYGLLRREYRGQQA